jgi:hypothetical protein
MNRYIGERQIRIDKCIRERHRQKERDAEEKDRDRRREIQRRKTNKD